MHTKGPWHRNIKPARKYPIIFAGRNTHICQVLNHVDDSEQESNCDLIAAAPELLDALRLFVEAGRAADAATRLRMYSEALQKAEQLAEHLHT